jgi:HEAT repeat protein
MAVPEMTVWMKVEKMFKIYLYIPIAFLLFLTACTSHTLHNPSTNDIPLEDLINQLPAQDSVKSKLVYGALLKYEENGVFEICRNLYSADEKLRSQSEWALHGLAIYVTGRNNEEYREIYIAGVGRALDYSLPEEKKAFLINQIKIAGREESIPLLQSYIYHQKLYEPAIQALSAIHTTSAGKVLLEALPMVEGQVKVSIIKALGTIQYEPASEELLKLTKDPNDRIKDVAVFALTNIGTKEAFMTVQSLAQTYKEYIPDYLRLAERRGERGDSQSCLKICNEIILNKNGYYPENSVINALYLQQKYNPQDALKQALQLISGDNKKIRLSAIEVVTRYKKADYVPSLINLCKESIPEIQSDILAVFGKQKCHDALPYISEMLKSPSLMIRMTSLLALSEIDQKKSLPEIVSVLRDSLSDYEAMHIKKILDTATDSTSINYFLDNFDQLSNHVKTLILTLISENILNTGSGGDLALSRDNNTSYTQYYLTSLNSSEPDLQIAALRGLEYIGDDLVLEELLSLYSNSTDQRQKAACLKTIKSIFDRSQSKKACLNVITDYYETSSIDDKILLLNLFRAVGNRDALNLTFREVEQGDENLCLAAVRSLDEWPDASALDYLIEIARTNEDIKFKILAQRGALRMLKDNPMGEQRAIGYYTEIMKSDLRAEEKRQVLAGLSDIKTISSLKLIASLLNDPMVKKEAYVAVLSFYQNEKITPQPPENFKALFNGENLEGWKGLVENPVKRAQMSQEELCIAQIKADSLMKKHWHVLDGILFFDGKGSHLCTAKDYSDFELYVDWKIEKDGDSGIYLRGSPQVQIWDPAYNPVGSGGLYNNKIYPDKPLVTADNAIGEWNTFHIIMRGKKVTVYLNDTLVVDNVEMENYWDRDKPIYTSGQIELQAHNTPLYFRNIYIRELEPQKPLFEGSLFNGKNLQGWQVIGNNSDAWQVKDGILFTEGDGAGWISTQDEFKDFELDLEYRLPEGGNSGVFIRAPHHGNPAYSGIEIQILDDQAEEYSNLKKWQYTGSIYGILGPEIPSSKNFGVWQKMKIICVGPSVKVSLNDELLIDTNLIDYMDREENHPGIKRRKGYIGLQNHSSKIEFRNIKIREIDK